MHPIALSQEKLPLNNQSAQKKSEEFTFLTSNSVRINSPVLKKNKRVQPEWCALSDQDLQIAQSLFTKKLDTKID